MSETTTATQAGEQAFDQFPTDQYAHTVAGWEQVEPDTDRTVLEYWRRGSTHIAAEYENFRISELGNGDLRLTNSCFDQFGHLIRTQTHMEHAKKKIDWLWERAKSRMQDHPATEAFDSKPQLPTTVGGWELVSGRTDGDLQTTRWEIPWGNAELVVKETQIESHYSHTKRLHRIDYHEPGSPHEIVTDIPRTMAFEIALNTLETLSKPLSELQEQQEQLQQVKGIGPTKAKQFLLLGIPSREAIKDHIRNGSSVNYHHDEAVEKILTTTIRSSLNDD